MPLFFVSPENIDEKKKIVTISGSEAKHITKSLRHKEKDEILITDGIKNRYLVKIENIEKENICCKIIHTFNHLSKPLPIKISLAQALLKKNKMDFVIQKATELGIHDIIPFTSSRTIPLIGKKSAEKKQERWQKIALEASKQSERMHVPEVQPIISFKELLKKTSNYDWSMIFWEEENVHNIKEVLQKRLKPSNMIYFIGPEGGFSEKEMQLARKANVFPVSLGEYVVRSETAAIFAMSVFNYYYYIE